MHDEYGRRLGLAHSSGWDGLSHGQGESPLAASSGSSDMHGKLDYGKIAEVTSDEMFGRRGRKAAFHAGRAVGNTRTRGRQRQRRGAARREHQRAGWGSPAWQAGLVPGQDWGGGGEMLSPYDEGAPGSDMLDAEIDAMLAEEADEGYDDQGYDDQGYDQGYGAVYDDYYGDEDADADEGDAEFGLSDEDENEDDDEFGRRGSFRRGVRRTAGRTRRRVRRGGRVAPHRGRHAAFRTGRARGRQLERQAATYEEPEPTEGWGRRERPGGASHPSRLDNYGAYYGDHDEHKVAAPPQGEGFGSSLISGLGLGLGVAAGFVGISILAGGLRSR